MDRNKKISRSKVLKAFNDGLKGVKVTQPLYPQTDGIPGNCGATNLSGLTWALPYATPERVANGLGLTIKEHPGSIEFNANIRVSGYDTKRMFKILTIVFGKPYKITYNKYGSTEYIAWFSYTRPNKVLNKEQLKAFKATIKGV